MPYHPMPVPPPPPPRVTVVPRPTPLPPTAPISPSALPVARHRRKWPWFLALFVLWLFGGGAIALIILAFWAVAVGTFPHISIFRSMTD